MNKSTPDPSQPYRSLIAGYTDAIGHTNPMHWGRLSNYVDAWLSEATQLTAGGLRAGRRR